MQQRQLRVDSTPEITKTLLIINIAMFLAANFLPNGIATFMNEQFPLYIWLSNKFEPYQFVTSMFMHGSLTHLIFNMLALWMFGSVIERILGPKRYFIFYFLCGLGAAVLHFGVQYWQLSGMLQTTNAAYILDSIPGVVGASGAIFGLLLAYGYLFPNQYIYIYAVVPLKAKWAVLLYGLAELSLGAGGYQTGVAHFAHLGGLITGLILLKTWGYRKIY